jgi:hypothetical protein
MDPDPEASGRQEPSLEGSTVPWKPNYATATELGEYVRVMDTQDDTEMASAVAAASRAVDQYCGRQFGHLDSVGTWYYTPWWDTTGQRWVADIEDLMTTTSLVVEVSVDGATFSTLTPDDFALRPVNAVQNGEPWTELHLLPSGGFAPGVGSDANVAVSGLFGWAAVPEGIKYATLLQASRYLSRRDSPYGIAGSPPRRDSGSGISVAAKELKILNRVDPDVADSLEAYRRYWWAA